MKRAMFLVFLGSLSLFSAGGTIHAANEDWKADVEGLLNEFLACKAPIDDRSPCNVFVGRAAKRVYGSADFEVPGKPNAFLSANQIAAYVANSERWTKLGTADDQAVLTEAQGHANLRRAIIAVYSSSPHGHVALVLPGKAVPSASWGLDVPNSASFFLNDPARSFVGKPLSNAFGADKKGSVTIYGRNFSVQ